ncbi:hypothetical protein [Campylobacter sp. CCS1377]|uniref:Uncharacterized protein n=1 Tax=Campylobacter sp. CCS1377 TaxID=3158229 RepID=A0AAU7EA58_9BACT|nr:hypothetical protein [Campylobacter jejuni]
MIILQKKSVGILDANLSEFLADFGGILIVGWYQICRIFWGWGGDVLINKLTVQLTPVILSISEESMQNFYKIAIFRYAQHDALFCCSESATWRISIKRLQFPYIEILHIHSE